MRRPTALLAGCAAAAVYVAVALVTFHSGVTPVRPLYDGGAPPPPYRWVIPPPELADINVPPQPGTGRVAFGGGGNSSEATTIATQDGQAIVAFQSGSVKPRQGETAVEVSIEPLDPDTLGRPPAEKSYDGNAYRVTATYAKSHEPIEIAATECPQTTPRVCPTVVLRFPTFGTELLRHDGTAWTTLEAHTSPVSLQIFADTSALGTFVVAGPTLPGEETGSSKLGLYLGLGLGGAALAVAVVTWRSNKARRLLKRWFGGSRGPSRPKPAGRGPTPRHIKKKKRR